MQLRIKKTHPSAIIPTRKKPRDSGLDLHVLLPGSHVWLQPGTRQRFSTGIAIELPLSDTFDTDGGPQTIGYEAQVRPRSGLAAMGILCSLGTVDNGYRGEIGVTLYNHSWDNFRVKNGDRIAQLVICPVVYPELVEVEELSETERGADGFGSTGL